MVLKADIESAGFKETDMILTETCKDEHPHWVWVRTQKC